MSRLLSDYNSVDRINSNVAWSQVYSDLNLSFVINPITKDVSPLTDTDAVKGAIKNLVLTNFFDRPFNPTFGSGLTALLFEPANTFTAIEIKTAIETVINKHEPRVTDVTIQVKDNPDENRYQVIVGFRVFYSDESNETSFFLTRLR